MGLVKELRNSPQVFTKRIPTWTSFLHGATVWCKRQLRIGKFKSFSNKHSNLHISEFCIAKCSIYIIYQNILCKGLIVVYEYEIAWIDCVGYMTITRDTWSMDGHLWYRGVQHSTWVGIWKLMKRFYHAQIRGVSVAFSWMKWTFTAWCCVLLRVFLLGFCWPVNPAWRCDCGWSGPWLAWRNDVVQALVLLSCVSSLISCAPASIILSSIQ